jgi:beta-galactosidase
MRKISALILVVGLCITTVLKAQNGKTTYTINTGWDFHIGDLSQEAISENTTQWESISIPHTWNAEDAFDDTPGYYRGIGVYKKAVFFSENDKNKNIVLHFEGANQETEVFVNGTSVGSHKGGYTAFSFPITEQLKFEKSNEILVKVTNAFDENIPTLTADFTFFGGIYRDVYIEKSNLIHFSNSKYSGEKVFISTPSVTNETASIQFKGHVSNLTDITKKIEVVQIIRNAEKEVVLEITQSYKVKSKENLQFKQEIASFKNPILWSPDNPYLYEVVTKIIDKKTKKVLDEVVNPLGFRWFEFHVDKGFLMNGKHYKLIGTNRHQDYLGIGNAVPDALQVKDVEHLKAMGGNFLRIAHYPQDPVILEACDRLGIITTIEIPLVNYITESPEFAATSIEMAKEMVYQDYNHPSLVSWAYMNEILLRPKYKNEPEKQKAYFKTITALAKDLEKVIRELDPYRYTMIPNHGNFSLYKDTELTEIPMLVGWNLYSGWYGNSLNGFEQYLDKHHNQLNKPLLVTEYGAGADPRVRSLTPERFDFSLEYQVRYHTHYLKEIMKRDFVAGVNIWNLADFASETRHDTRPFVNSKGVMTLDRKPKDAYYLYQAFLKTTPFIAIGSKLWKHRSGFTDVENGVIATQPISVFTNQKSAVLYLNGTSLGEKFADENKTLIWDVPFVNGENLLEVVAEENGKAVKDFHRLDFNLIAKNLDSKTVPFKSVRLTLGSKRYFLDELINEIWLPAKEYRTEKDAWGFVGGTSFKMKNTSRQGYGTDQNIKNTNNDPIYQTAQVGLEAFTLNVPDGFYELTLHFAELISDKEKEVLAYNLDANAEKEALNSNRIFDVLVNGNVILEKLNIAKEYGSEKAVSIKIKQLVTDKQGIIISFRPIKGEPILNAVELVKVF